MGSWGTSVVVHEERDTRQENFDIESNSMQAVLRCAWNDRIQVAQDIVGGRAGWPFSWGGAARPRAKQCSIVGSGVATDGSDFCNYVDALITVNYSPSDVDDTGGDLYSESIEPSAEFLTLDYKQFAWGSASGDALEENEAPGRLLKTLNLVKTFFHVRYVPSFFITSVGGVNDSSYYSFLLGISFDAETLLYQPPKISRTISTEGDNTFTLEVKYTFKPEGWNKYWRAKTESYQSLYIKGGAEYKSYPAISLPGLI